MKKAGALLRAVECVRATGADVVLIGASAMAGHGAARATTDVDLLCVDATVLRDGRWARVDGLTTDVRLGEGGDPLDGVVRTRLGGPHQRP